MKKLTLIFPLFFTYLLFGCSGKASPQPSPQGADITGQWTFLAVDTSSNQTFIFANFTSQGNGNFFATGMNTANCSFPELLCAVAVTPTINATVSSANKIQVTVSNLVDTITTRTTNVSASGTVNSSGTSMSGNWTASDGTSGTWQGYKASSFAGSYVGSLNSTKAPSPIPVGVTATLSQDATYNLTGNAVLTNSICYSNLAFTGHAIGGALFLTNGAAGTLAANSIVIVGIESNPSTPKTFQAEYQLLTGCGAPDQGLGTLTKQ